MEENNLPLSTGSEQPLNQAAPQVAATNDMNLITPDMKTPKSKKGLILGVVGVLVAVTAAGSFFLFSKDVPETPPSLSIKDNAKSNLTGMMEQAADLEIDESTYRKNMLGFDDDDIDAFDANMQEYEWEEVGAIAKADEDQLFASGWFINNSGEDITFKDVYDRIDPDTGAVIIITFDPENNWITSYQDVFVPAEGSEYDITILSIEDMEDEDAEALIANGQAFQVMSYAEGMIYDPDMFGTANLGTDTYEELDFCGGDSEGWLLGSLGADNAAKTLCACGTAVQAVHVWDSTKEDWNQIFSENSGEDITDLQAAEYDNTIAWVLLSESPAESENICDEIDAEEESDHGDAE